MVEIEVLPHHALVNVRVDPKGPAADGIGLALGAALPVEPNTVATADGVDVLWLGPDEWLVMGPPGALKGLVTRLSEAVGGEHASIVDTSAARTVVRVEGEHARAVLAHGCPLDLHPRVFGPGRCAQSLLAGEHVVLVAREDGFLVLVRTSAARYLTAWLTDAATEYRTNGAASR